MRPGAWIPWLVIAAAGSWVQAGGSPGVRLELELERDAGRSRLWARTAGETHLLRETSAAVTLDRSGGDPAGRAAFATWYEDGVPWSAFLPEGRGWSEARPLAVTLRLRAGSARPRQAMPPARSGLVLPPGGRVFVVQFRTVSLPAWRTALEEAGAVLLSPFPHNAHLVRVGPARLAALRALDFVLRVEPYHPAYRLEPELLAWLDRPPEGPEGDDRLRVRVQAFEWGEPGKARIAARAREIGAGIESWWPNGHIIELWVDREQLREIASHDDVLWIDRHTPPETDMDLVRQDAGVDWLETSFGSCGQGVRGEVLDNGVQTDHPDLDGILLHGQSSVASHGTSTYGIVFGNGARDGDGNAQATGHMPCAEQGIFADFDFLGDRFAHTQELKQAPYFASFQSNSWGGGLTTLYTTESQEMDDIIWRLDIAITQSQSNTGNRDSRPQAWAKNIISVGGIFHRNTLDTADDEWLFGASIGPAEDGRIKPDLHYWYDSIFTTTTNSSYTNFGGTSAATPEVAGVLGLFAQMWSDNVWNTNPLGTTVFERLPHFTTLKALLINNAKQYPFSGTNHDLTRVHQGWGRPNAQIAHERAARSFIIDEDVLLQLAEAVLYDVDVPIGETELKVTMTYPDPPGITSATLHRINDLDLKVTSPSGAVYHGNVGLDAGTESVAGGAPNGVDTVENVFVMSPEPGTWKVEISAAEVNQDAEPDTPPADVPFALVVTGGTGALCPAPTASFTLSPNPARVGDDVLFDSTVSGGAGAPYAYAWDFEDDGVIDDSAADPVHVYRRPHVGDARLRVRDAEQCPQTVAQPVTVTGPDLRFDRFFGLTEIDGNGNGALDPGEVWELRVDLRNDGNEPALGVSAELFADPANPGTVQILERSSGFPDIPLGGVASSASAYRFAIGHDFPCGRDALLGLTRIRSVDPGNVYPDEPAVIRILVGGSGPPVDFHVDGFEGNGLGWSRVGDGEWEFAAPQGLGGEQSVPGQVPKPDPTAAFEGLQVMGTDLSGQGQRPGSYENDIVTTSTSPPVDATGVVGTAMHFARWLNTESGDLSYVEVSADGATWTRLFEDSAGVSDAAWSEHSYDVAALFDGQEFARVRFGLESDGFLVQGGWNVDALRFSGVTRESCEPFAASSPGAVPELLVARGAAGSLQLSWTQDCGGGTTYAIYRGDLHAGYGSLAPEPGRCSVAGTTDSVPQGPGSADFFLVVPNDGAEEGSYGKDSTGSARTPPAAACLPAAVPAVCSQ